jgi:hypothetical protein
MHIEALAVSRRSAALMEPMLDDTGRAVAAFLASASWKARWVPLAPVGWDLVRMERLGITSGGRQRRAAWANCHVFLHC